MILRNRKNHPNTDDFKKSKKIIQIWMVLRNQKNHPNLDDLMY